MHELSNMMKRQNEKACLEVQQWFGTTFTNNKAGMADVDKDKVKRVVYEMSKDTPHFKHGLRLQAQTEDRIRTMKQQARKLTPAQLLSHTRAMDCKVAELRAGTDLTRIWIHADLDAFFASVEELDDPSLKTKPMAVGELGMITTANYVARKFGIRSAMPGYIGKRLCPELVFVQPDFGKYVRAAAAVRAIFVDFDARFEAGSLDEAYLNVTDYCKQHGLTGEAVAENIRRRVREETRLTCSCGIGPNRLLSKIATDIRKPDGQFAIGSDHTSIQRFIDPLPVRKIPGIGKVTEQILKALDFQTCNDLIAKRGMISALFKPLSVDFFIKAGLGFGQTGHSALPEPGAVGRRGMSVERTFPAVWKPADLEAWCAELSDKLAEDMASEGLQGKTITLKLKETNFELRTRDKTLPTYISSPEDIFREAMKLLKPELPIKIRLMGVGMSSFLETNTGLGQRTLSGFLQLGDSTPAARYQAGPDLQGWKQTFLDAQTRQEVAKHMAEYKRWKEEHPGEMRPGHVWHHMSPSTSGAGAFWSGIPNGSGLLPEPKHFWYDIHEYRLNSKPHIRRILQHQQAQANGSTQASEASMSAGTLSQNPGSSCERQALQRQQAQEDGSGQAIAEQGVAAWRAAQLPESGKGVAECPQPEQRHKSSAQAAAAPCQASSREHIKSDGWQQPGSAEKEQHAANKASLEDAKHRQGSHGKRPAPDSWQPVTASQILKHQRLADTGLERKLQSKAAVCQQLQPEQPSLPADCMTEAATGCDILLQPSEQEACDSSALLEDSAEPGQFGDSEESCEDVLAMWGEAGEPDQEFAWAEPPAGMGNGDTEGSSASAKHAASMAGHRTWACQVCTFSDNRVQILRCAMCDAVRGTSWKYFRTTHAEASLPEERPAADLGEARGRAEAQKGTRAKAQAGRRGIKRFLV